VGKNKNEKLPDGAGDDAEKWGKEKNWPTPMGVMLQFKQSSLNYSAHVISSNELSNQRYVLTSFHIPSGNRQPLVPSSNRQQKYGDILILTIECCSSKEPKSAVNKCNLAGKWFLLLIKKPLRAV
jgi:hypothetical protein